jgi:hypothetical protein
LWLCIAGHCLRGAFGILLVRYAWSIAVGVLARPPPAAIAIAEHELTMSATSVRRFRRLGIGYGPRLNWRATPWISLRSTILYRTIGSHWPEACRSCHAFVGLHYRRDPTGVGLDQCACDALMLSPLEPPIPQSATQREW